MGATLSAINDAVAIYIYKPGNNRKKLAEEMGMDRNTLKRKLNGDSEFTMGEFDKLCTIVGAIPSDILSRS